VSRISDDASQTLNVVSATFRTRPSERFPNFPEQPVPNTLTHSDPYGMRGLVDVDGDGLVDYADAVNRLWYRNLGDGFSLVGESVGAFPLA